MLSTLSLKIKLHYYLRIRLDVSIIIKFRSSNGPTCLVMVLYLYVLEALIIEHRIIHRLSEI